MDFLTSEFLAVADAYLKASGEFETNVSRWLFRGAGNRLTAIRNGRDINATTMARALLEMSDAWPADSLVEWPDHVPRPHSSTAKRRKAAVSVSPRVVRTSQKRQRA